MSLNNAISSLEKELIEIKNIRAEMTELKAKNFIETIQHPSIASYFIWIFLVIHIFYNFETMNEEMLWLYGFWIIFSFIGFVLNVKNYFQAKKQIFNFMEKTNNLELVEKLSKKYKQEHFTVKKSNSVFRYNHNKYTLDNLYNYLCNAKDTLSIVNSQEMTNENVIENV